MKTINSFVRILIKGGVIMIMILSIPVKVFNYFADFHWGKHDKKLGH